MTAEIQETGYVTAGFNSEGKLVESDVSVILATVPGERGEWMFIVKDGQFSWIKGLAAGQGYEEYTKPDCDLSQISLTRRQELIKSLAKARGPWEDSSGYSFKRVEPGNSCRLEENRLVLVSK